MGRPPVDRRQRWRSKNCSFRSIHTVADDEDEEEGPPPKKSSAVKSASPPRLRTLASPPTPTPRCHPTFFRALLLLFFSAAKNRGRSGGRKKVLPLCALSFFFTHTLVVVVLAVAGSVTFDSGGGAPTLLGMQARNQAALLLRSLAASGRLGGCEEETGQRSKNHSFPLLLRCPCSPCIAKAGPARSVRPPVPPTFLLLLLLPHPLAHQKTQMWPTLEYVRRRGGTLAHVLWHGAPAGRLGGGRGGGTDRSVFLPSALKKRTAKGSSSLSKWGRGGVQEGRRRCWRKDWGEGEEGEIPFGL